MDLLAVRPGYQACSICIYRSVNTAASHPSDMDDAFVAHLHDEKRVSSCARSPGGMALHTRCTFLPQRHSVWCPPLYRSKPSSMDCVAFRPKVELASTLDT